MPSLLLLMIVIYLHVPLSCSQFLTLLYSAWLPDLYFIIIITIVIILITTTITMIIITI